MTEREGWLIALCVTLFILWVLTMVLGLPIYYYQGKHKAYEEMLRHRIRNRWERE